MRVEQEEGDLFRGEIRLARDRDKRGSVGIGPLLVAIDDVTGGAPALGEIEAMVGVGRYRRRSSQPCCGNDQNPNLSQNRAHTAFSFGGKCTTLFVGMSAMGLVVACPC